eukprot:CAMPEP_0118952600 /NCGR_PEP_ID=MMETSP1169-20130426/55162_1 /TAXON_ID=36882 /ORGANISM="Pyramimonas obovata, Strain CCMP722" /LENGTH=85 /DNA_ID=CAMNT_0006899899 /DNA_START=396 /DNA_END=653 /DNA_ORIENTATION=+
MCRMARESGGEAWRATGAHPAGAQPRRQQQGARNRARGALHADQNECVASLRSGSPAWPHMCSHMCPPAMVTPLAIITAHRLNTW